MYSRKLSFLELQSNHVNVKNEKAQQKKNTHTEKQNENGKHQRYTQTLNNENCV